MDSNGSYAVVHPFEFLRRNGAIGFPLASYTTHEFTALNLWIYAIVLICLEPALYHKYKLLGTWVE